MIEPTVIETDVQCGRCGSSMGFDDCHVCGGEGEYEGDGDWDMETCPECRGAGGLWSCLSSDEWCESHPRPGREAVTRHTEEWFEILSDGTTRIVTRNEP